MPKLQQQLEKSLLNLKHSMPMLATALNMSINYPKNNDGWQNREFAWQQVSKVTAEILDIICCPLRELPSIGVISQHVQAIESMLHVERRNVLSMLQIETTVQSLVQQIMQLVMFANERSTNHQLTTTALVKESSHLLYMTSKLTQHQTPTGNSPDFATVCRSICGKGKVLHKLSNKLITSLFCESFSISTEPMTNLAAIVKQCVADCPDPITEEKVKILHETFKSHAEVQLECAKFASKLCTDAEMFSQFQSCIGSMESLMNQLGHMISHLPLNDIGEEIGEVEVQWKEGIKSLINFCLKCIGQETLTAHLETDMLSNFEHCNEDIVDLDELKLSADVILATGKAKLLAIVAQQIVDEHSDPIFRNGVLAHIRKLHDCVARVVASGNHLIEDVARLPSQEGFLASVSSLQTQVANVNLSLRSKCNHPELTSKARKGLRDFTDQDLICGTIKEMHALNQKLAALGYHANVGPLTFEQEDGNENQTQERKASSDAANLPEADSDTLHPIVADFIEAVHQGATQDVVDNKFNMVKQASEFLQTLANECECCLQSSTIRIKNVANNPKFITESESGSNLTPIADGTLVWLKSHLETTNVMEEKDNIADMMMWKSLAKTWTQSFNICFECCHLALELHTIGFRKFMDLDYTDNNKEALDASANSETLVVSGTQDPLIALRRNCDTYITLVRDIVMLSRQQSAGRSDEKKSRSREMLNRLLEDCKNLAADILQKENVIQQIHRKVEAGSSKVDKSWLQIHAVTCASKVNLLSRKCSEVADLVLGVRSLCFPAESLYNSDSTKLLNYKRRARTLTSSILNKVKKTLNASSLELNEFSKVTKVKDRIDVTCGSIEKIIDFLVLHIPSERLLHRHGNIIDHLMFLHLRFILEVSRVSLLAKQLDSGSASVPGGSVHGNSYPAAPESFIEDPQNTLTFDQRLSNLVEERKRREREMLSTLSC
uniref:Uncharacterized protein LOC100184888 n=1 Tax=Phallusia mammillata TaxID=59560 RepID=A0A6F9DID0_9ASCI|nr:uncharacterized protein LOC100184888 [Phallusia mammillata]